jgi:hypothetical protein
MGELSFNFHALRTVRGDRRIACCPDVERCVGDGAKLESPGALLEPGDFSRGLFISLDFSYKETARRALAISAASGAPPEQERQRTEAAWGHRADNEPRWPASLAVCVAILLYVTLPQDLTLPQNLTYGKWVLPILEGALIVPLTIMYPRRHDDESTIQRFMALGLIALINVANLISLILLIHELLSGTAVVGRSLIYGSMGIWVTNVIVFGLWYWELDRGGPGQRCKPAHERREPDFMFPQMANPQVAPKGWHPTFVDYLYVSFTNASAFSPTDTMPLTRWAKLLMTVQSAASLVTVVLVTARAVNILK